MVMLWAQTKSMDFLTLITFLLFLVPATSSTFTHRKIIATRLQADNITSYAVVFDAGSTGSRVHVFHFDQNLDLLHIGNDVEFYNKTTPGLSSYADDPEKAAESLVPLLRQAESVVPADLHSKTPVRVGATAGLRLLEGNASEKILQAVTNMLTNRSDLNLQSDAVAILDGTQEGSYLWVTVNYILGNLGKSYSQTVAVADLGGGSVQMAYAVSRNQAKKAPKVADGEDPYIKTIVLKGKKYYLYVHSYLHFGREASRVGILTATNGSANPCILAGFNGTFTYSGVEYKAIAPASGPNYDECREIIVETLKVNKPCPHPNCTFGGIWNGGGGSGQKNLFATSSFYYLPSYTGIVDPNKPNSKIRIMDLKNGAKRVCKTKFEDANTTYPLIGQKALPYACLDLIYMYTLLVDGFGLDASQEITVANQIEYEDAVVDASWPLGSAIEAISSLANFERLMYFI